MALRFSTGMVQALMQRRGLKEALHDGVIKVYSGSQPATADAAVTGTLLLTVTNASGAFTADTPSTAQVSEITITGITASTTYSLIFTPPASDYATETHTYVSPGSGQTADLLGQALANTINSGSDATEPSAYAHAIFNAADDILYVAFAPGIAVVTTDTESGGATDMTVVSETTADVRTNGLQFGASTAGVLAKEADIVWSGAVAATGTAGWFRFSANPTDAGALSTTLVRMDGACGTSNSDMNLSSVNLVAATTVTVDTFSITQPKVRT